MKTQRKTAGTPVSDPSIRYWRTKTVIPPGINIYQNDVNHLITMKL